MKNKIFALLCALLLCGSISAAAAEQRVFDGAGLFSTSEEAKLENAIADFQKTTGMDYVIVTTRKTHDEDESQQDVVDRYYEDNGFGFGEERSGAIYYIDMYGRREYISTTGAMIDYLDDDRREAAFDQSNPYLRRGEYAQAAMAMLTELKKDYKAGIPEGQYRYDIVTGQRLTARHKALTAGEIAVSVLGGLVVAWIVGGSISRRYKLKGSTYTYDCNANANLTLTESNDEYLRTTVTRTRKAPPPESGGGFGGGSGGTGVHTSSGGMSHGGGSRGF